MNKIGFIGAGAMMEAITKGILRSGFVSKENIFASDVSDDRIKYLCDTYEINAMHDNDVVARTADFLFLAIKPQMFAKVVTEKFLSNVSTNTTIVSIMGSVEIAHIAKYFTKQNIIRVMPNTPLAVGAGMTAVTALDSVPREKIDFVKNVFLSSGECIEIAENYIEAVTAISGCGPGYVFVIIDALADAGVMAGLPRNLAIKLAAQTFAGAGKMVIETSKHPAELRDQVTSPGGTTIAGIRALEKHGVRYAMYEAVHNVIERSKELGK